MKKILVTYCFITAFAQNALSGDYIIRLREHVDQDAYLPSWSGSAQYSTSPLKAGRFTLQTFKMPDGTIDSLWIRNPRENNSGLRAGVALRKTNGSMYTQTTTRYSPGRSDYSWESGRWITVFDIDIPHYNPKLEKMLCKLLYGRGKSIDQDGAKFAKKFEGRYVKGDKYNNIVIHGHLLGYKPSKYMSYFYQHEYISKINAFGSMMSIDETAKRIIDEKKSHNVIIDLQTMRILTLSDVLTLDEITRIGLKKKSKADLGLDGRFLYVGIDGKLLATYLLSQQNWKKFTPAFQELIGSSDQFVSDGDPLHFDFSESDGIQPVNVSLKIDTEPSFKPNTDSLMAYLTSHLEISELWEGEQSMTLQFILSKDGKISHLEVRDKKGANASDITKQLISLFENMPTWQPLVLSGIGNQQSMLSYDFNLTPTDGVRQPLMSMDRGGKIFDVVEQMPEFPGGQAALLKWVSDNMRYPTIAEENGIQGRVVCTFVIERDGSVSDVQVARSIDPSLDKEAVRVLKKMPRWKPGKQKGQPVRVKHTVTVTFKLQ